MGVCLRYCPSRAEAEASEALLPSLGHPAGPLDLLALGLPGLPLPAAGPLAALVARPASTPPAPLVRRWALLVLAGPTVSYRTLGPAPTLGLISPDFARLGLRYRLGGAGGRGQCPGQPTGRYVATPFVRADAVGFMQRQPFSLGFLTGFPWDVR